MSAFGGKADIVPWHETYVVVGLSIVVNRRGRHAATRWKRSTAQGPAQDWAQGAQSANRFRNRCRPKGTTRPAYPRTRRGASAADSHERSAKHHSPFTGGCPTCVRRDRPKCRASVWCHLRRCLFVRKRSSPHCRHQQLLTQGDESTSRPSATKAARSFPHRWPDNLGRRCCSHSRCA